MGDFSDASSRCGRADLMMVGEEKNTGGLHELQECET
jgi:hypothetical protein